MEEGPFYMIIKKCHVEDNGEKRDLRGEIAFYEVHSESSEKLYFGTRPNVLAKDSESFIHISENAIPINDERKYLRSIDPANFEKSLASAKKESCGFFGRLFLSFRKNPPDRVVKEYQIWVDYYKDVIQYATKHDADEKTTRWKLREESTRLLKFLEDSRHDGQEVQHEEEEIKGDNLEETIELMKSLEEREQESKHDEQKSEYDLEESKRETIRV